MKFLVIGADRGLGRVLVQMLCEAGHEVAAGLYDQGNADSEQRNVLYLPMDVTNEEQLSNAAEKIRTDFGQLDGVVSLAGVLLPSDRICNMMTEPIADLKRHMDVNAIGLVSAFRVCYPLMKQGSRYFAVTSEAGSYENPCDFFPGYSVSKVAANKYVEALRMTADMSRTDLFAVHPGRMNTEMGHSTAEIEPEESARGFIGMLEGTIPVDGSREWFIDYLGRPMR